MPNRYVAYIQDVLISVHANLHDLHKKRVSPTRKNWEFEEV